MSTLKKGFLITLEGGEGAGKTTQIKLLKAFLETKGYTVVTTREPGGSDAAEAMRDLFVAYDGANWPLQAQALLMFAARSHHTESLIKPALDKGHIVLCDRYTDSTRVYQGYAGGMSLEAIEIIKQQSIGEFEPDMTFMLDIDPEQGLGRGAGRDNDTDTTFEMKNLEFHKKLRQGFLDIAKNDAARCRVINAAQTEEDVAQDILINLRELLASV